MLPMVTPCFWREFMPLKTKLLMVNINQRKVVITLDDILLLVDIEMASLTAAIHSSLGMLV